MRPLVVFVCEHGAAKSVVAAAWLRRLADDAGLPLDAVACGTDPSPELSRHAMAGLAGDGLAPAPSRPRPLGSDELRRAWWVVRFGQELSLPTPSTAPVETWDVPAVSDGYDAARDAIVSRLHQLLAIAWAATDHDRGDGG
jgi:protein-tyrosine-phosphatase